MKEKQRSKKTNSHKIQGCSPVLWEGYKSMPVNYTRRDIVTFVFIGYKLQ